MALLNETQQDYYDGDDFGGYQFISLNDIINNFIVAYVGDGKIIPKVKRTDIAFHAQRAIQELSFDTFKSIKSQEISLPPSNTMVLPQDYVNYTRILWTDSNGVKHPIYPTKHTQNPFPVCQDSVGDYTLTATATLTSGESRVVLDGIYPNILSGMDVAIPNPDAILAAGVTYCTVYRAHVEGGVTVVDLIYPPGYGQGNFAVMQVTGDYTLTFSNPDGSLVECNKNIHYLDNLSWTSGEYTITQSPNADVSNIEVGMEISAWTNLFASGISQFSTKTFVTSVNGGVITVSRPLLFNSTLLVDGGRATFHMPGNSTTWSSFSSDTSSSGSDGSAYNHDTDIYDLNIGQRYGLEPSLAQTNGTYFIDTIRGLIHFSSNLSGRTIVLDYISDGLGTDEEMIVHKFAEEAMYKSIAYAIFSTTIAGQQLVPRFKKEKFAAIRQAKLRLSNLKIEELAQVMRGKSKWIKH